MKSEEELATYWASSGNLEAFGEDGHQAADDCIYALSLGETCFNTHCRIWATQTDEDLKDSDIKYQQAVKTIELFVNG